MTDCSIQVARIADADRVARLFYTSVRQLTTGNYTPLQVAAWAGEAPDPARWKPRIRSQMFFLALVDTHLAGFLGYESDGHIDTLFVHPSFARKGVATRLVRHVEKKAETQGQTRLFTEASWTARPFFERMGFDLEAAQQVTFNGQIFENFRMEKIIGLNRT